MFRAVWWVCLSYVFVPVLLFIFYLGKENDPIQRSAQDSIPPPNYIVPQKPNEIHLITQWYWDNNKIRRAELAEALRRNLMNSHIHRIHLIGGDEKETLLKAYADDIQVQDLVHQKIEWVSAVHNASDIVVVRLVASDAFQYAANYLRGQIVMLANLDIYFDNSLRLLLSEDCDLSLFLAYFLSRYEESDNEEVSVIGTQCGPRFIGSHDTIIFIPPIPRLVIQNCTIQLGTWGIENRIMWEFEQVGMTGRNPCFDIKSWHLHRSGVKNDNMPSVNDQNRSSIAFPDFIISNRTHLDDPTWFLWKDTREYVYKLRSRRVIN